MQSPRMGPSWSSARRSRPSSQSLPSSPRYAPAHMRLQHQMLSSSSRGDDIKNTLGVLTLQSHGFLHAFQRIWFQVLGRRILARMSKDHYYHMDSCTHFEESDSGSRIQGRRILARMSKNHYYYMVSCTHVEDSKREIQSCRIRMQSCVPFWMLCF